MTWSTTTIPSFLKHTKILVPRVKPYFLTFVVKLGAKIPCLQVFGAIGCKNTLSGSLNNIVFKVFRSWTFNSSYRKQSRNQLLLIDWENEFKWSNLYFMHQPNHAHWPTFQILSQWYFLSKLFHQHQMQDSSHFEVNLNLINPDLVGPVDMHVQWQQSYFTTCDFCTRLECACTQ